MEFIPALSIIAKVGIGELDRIRTNLNEEPDNLRLMLDFEKFIEYSYIKLFSNKKLDEKEINNSYFLEKIVKSFYDGRKGIELTFGDRSEVETLEYLFTIHFFFKLDKIGGNIVNISEFLKDWRCISNIKKQEYTVGGENPDFSSWKALHLQKLPVSSFIIVDPFFLSNRKLALYNLKKIIEGLIDIRERQRSIEILIITKQSTTAPLLETEYLEICECISLNIKDSYKNLSLKLSYVCLNSIKVHWRILFSNFYYIKSDNGFRFYNENGGFYKERSIDLTINYLTEIRNFQTFRKRLFEMHKAISDPNSLIFSYGSKSSKLFNYLNFIITK